VRARIFADLGIGTSIALDRCVQFTSLKYLALAAFPLVLACSSNASGPDPQSDAGADASSHLDAADDSDPKCPVTIPADGSACTTSSTCTYPGGVGQDYQCSCDLGRWSCDPLGTAGPYVDAASD
jgi:hypothetical protein